MTENTIALLSAKLDRTLTKDDQIAFMDYCAFYGLEKGEEAEYVDSFINECYHLIENDPYSDEPHLELNFPDALPFAHQVHKKNWHQWSWGGCTITKLD